MVAPTGGSLNSPTTLKLISTTDIYIYIYMIQKEICSSNFSIVSTLFREIAKLYANEKQNLIHSSDMIEL